MGIPCKSLHEAFHYDAKQHRKTIYPESLLLKCKSYEFQIYSKYIEMTQRNRKNPESAMGLVRIELRASIKKLRQLTKKYHMASPDYAIENFLLLSPLITKKITKYTEKNGRRV